MDIKEIKTKYKPVRQLDKDDKGTVEVVQSDGKQYVLRTMNGNISVYKALQKINSPYLTRIEYAGFDGEKTIVLEEYIPGERNISVLTEEKQVVAAFCELCDVLEVLHRHGIVHRDIKPSNILLAPDGHIRLIDFDASRHFDEGKENDTRYLGTKGYAPPEQFGYSQTNAASDIYSLGVTLKTVLGQKSEKRKFRRIIRKCTEFDPKNRYQSASAVKRALKFGGMTFLLPVLLFAAAVLSCALYFFGNIYGKSSEELLSMTETGASSSLGTTTTAAASSVSTTTVFTTTSAAATTTEVTTTVPVTEETTIVPETEDASAESLTEETTETSVTSAASSQTTASTTAVKTTTTAAKTTAAVKTTTEKTTTTLKSETTTVPSSSETESQTTSPTGLPAGKVFRKLLTCITDSTKVPAFTRYEFKSGNFCDVLDEPFEFVTDKAVLGVWSELDYESNGAALFPKMYYSLEKAPRLDTFPKLLVFNEDGTCYSERYTNYGGILKFDYSSDQLNWTYGMIETPAVEEYYFYERYYIYKDESGEEYLFVEQKNGDYMRARNPEAGLHYYIYERYKGQ